MGDDCGAERAVRARADRPQPRRQVRCASLVAQPTSHLVFNQLQSRSLDPPLATMADPLGGTGSPGYQARVSHTPNPQSPFQQQSPYRAQPLPPPPTTSAWGSPPSSPQQHQQPQYASGSAGGPGVGATGGPGSPAGAYRAPGGMEPRSAQAYEWRRGDGASDDEGGRARNGSGAEPHAPVQQAAPTVRVRVIGLDKNRKDFYIKFNAEVSLLAMVDRVSVRVV